MFRSREDLRMKYCILKAVRAYNINKALNYYIITMRYDEILKIQTLIAHLYVPIFTMINMTL